MWHKECTGTHFPEDFVTGITSQLRMKELQWKMEEVPICQEALITSLKHPENLHRNACLANLQCRNRNICMKYLRFPISLVFVQACSDLVGSQRDCNINNSQWQPSTKQNQAEPVVYNVTNKCGDNLRSTQEASLSTSLGSFLNPTTLKPRFLSFSQGFMRMTEISPFALPQTQVLL